MSKCDATVKILLRLKINLIDCVFLIFFFFCRKPETALKLMHKATVMPNHKAAYHDETETVQNRLYKSLKLWSLYADLEESFGSFKVGSTSSWHSFSLLFFQFTY